MSFDPVVTNPGRLRILASLASEPSQGFVQLRSATQLTDGNLSTHARRLASAGLIAIDKRFESGKPLTTITLTPQGRRALHEHVERLTAALQPAPAPVASLLVEEDPHDNWVD
jgi:DNA-binding MarR family transcriptional regulator